MMHVQCEDCGKCRVTQQAEEWCGDCEYFSCERQEDCKDEVAALLTASDALEMQPPMLQAQYVATLRLYAAEPWRLTTCPSECAATNHPGAEHGATK